MVLLEELARPDGEVFFRLYYDESKGLYRSQWIGTLTQEEIQLATHKGLDHFHKFDPSLFLLDHSQSKNQWRDICTWIRVMWTPKFITTSLRYFAHLTQDHESACRGADHDLVHGAVCRVFVDEAKATDWLLSVRTKTLA